MAPRLQKAQRFSSVRKTQQVDQCPSKNRTQERKWNEAMQRGGKGVRYVGAVPGGRHGDRRYARGRGGRAAEGGGGLRDPHRGALGQPDSRGPAQGQGRIGDRLRLFGERQIRRFRPRHA